MAVTPKNAEALRKEVAERKNFIKSILNFFESTVSKHGTVISKDECRDHTKVIQDMHLEKFYFHWVTGMTCMGGNRIEIFYESKKQKVFSLYYQGSEALDECKVEFSEVVDECKVEFFDAKLLWQMQLRTVLNRQSEYLREKAEKKRRAKQAAEKARQEQEELARLEKEAKRLGILD